MEKWKMLIIPRNNGALTDSLSRAIKLRLAMSKERKGKKLSFSISHPQRFVFFLCSVLSLHSLKHHSSSARYVVVCCKSTHSSLSTFVERLSSNNDDGDWRERARRISHIAHDALSHRHVKSRMSGAVREEMSVKSFCYRHCSQPLRKLWEMSFRWRLLMFPYCLKLMTDASKNRANNKIVLSFLLEMILIMLFPCGKPRITTH